MTSITETRPLREPAKAGPITFAAIFSLESFVRSINSTVIALQAYDILHSSQRVSILFTAMSFLVLTTTLLLPVLLGRLAKRQAYVLGVVLMIAACLALATHTLAGQALGMFMRNVGAAFMNITLSLYILDHIRRRELTRSEPLRLSLSTFSWMIGPALGAWLYAKFGAAGPQAVAILSAAILLGVFLHLKLHEGKQAARPPKTFNPVANVKRFMVQPRLRLAWAIAFGRSCFWTTFFIYGPLLMVEAGLPKTYGGLLISASQALLLSAYLFGRIAQIHGVRVVVALSFALGAVASAAAGIAGVHHPYTAAGLLLVGALAASALDGVGGIPFLRSVRPHERARMTPVYRTFIDSSELIPSFIFAFALLYFEIGSVFVILGAGMALVGLLSWRYLPRSM